VLKWKQKNIDCCEQLLIKLVLWFVCRHLYGDIRKIVSMCYSDILRVLFPGWPVDGRKVDSFDLTFSPLPLKKERKKETCQQCVSLYIITKHHCILFLF